MLFNVEYDHGSVIEGYLIPDGFSGQSSIVVSDDSGTLGHFVCNHIKPAVAQVNRHETGSVGFKLDEENIPRLSTRTTLVIRDEKTGLLIYRRSRDTHRIPLKILRLETQILPMVKFDHYAGKHFQYEAAAIERFGHETTLQVFLLHAIESVYVSGRLLMRNYEDYLNKGFQGIVLLTDPYYEMALRIFLFKRMATTQISFLGERDRLILSSAVEYFAEANLEDQDGLKALLKKAPQKVINVLSSPATRQLVTTTPEQRITRRDIAPAIDLLSRFTIVGHNSDVATFQNAVSELFGIASDGLVVPPRQTLLEDIANKLRALPIAELILEEDLIFDHYVRQAMISPSPEARNKNAERYVAKNQ